MASHLVPQMRADKNGRVQKRWVRPDGGAPGGQRAPLPPAPPVTVTKDEPTAPVLTSAQKERREQYPRFVNGYEYDADVMVALGIEETPTYMVYSDAELFDLIAVTPPEVAVLFLQRDAEQDGGKRSTTGAEAAEFLTENGMDDLLVDRRELVTKALARRIDTYEVLNLHAAAGSAVMDADPDRFLDAAMVKSSEEFEYREEYWRGVLNGHISLKDMEEVGFERIASLSSSLLPWFEGMSRLPWLEAATLKRVADEVKWHGELVAPAMTVIRDHGAEYFSGLLLPRGAAAIADHYLDASIERRRALIDYSEAGIAAGRSFEVKDVAALLDSGLDALDAAQLLAKGMTVEQVVDAKRNGISGNVSSGWL